MGTQRTREQLIAAEARAWARYLNLSHQAGEAYRAHQAAEHATLSIPTVDEKPKINLVKYRELERSVARAVAKVIAVTAFLAGLCFVFGLMNGLGT